MAPRPTDDASAVLAALEALSRGGPGWVETGAVADAMGTSVGEAAARLRAASRRGLCASRRSLVHGTTWRALSEARRLQAERTR